MMLAARGAFLTGKLPYDAEVEYLESTGTQYIDTGVVISPVSAVAITIKYTRISSTSNDAQHIGFIKGLGSGNYRIIIGQNNYYSRLYVASSTYGIIADTNKHYYMADLKSRTIMIDGSSKGLSDTLTGSFNQTFYIFARNEDGVPKLFCHERIYAASFRENDVIIRDIIPVRFTNELGQSEGAMYDRLGTGGMNPDGSPRTDGLYRIRGTGAFVIGPDKTA